MAPPRLITSLLLAVFALLSTVVVAGTALRHSALDTKSTASIDLNDDERMSVPRRMEVQEYMDAMIDPPLYCYTEPDFDFVDNDLSNVPASAASQCCSLCHQANNNCKAWSWSNYNGGTCWLKSQRGAVIYKPGVQSSLLFYSPQPTCVLQPNTAYVGNDIGSVNQPNPSNCCQVCKNFPGCRAFTFNNFNGGTCWFKSSKGGTAAAPGSSSAEVYPASVSDPLPTCDGLKPGVDYFDHDIGNAPSPTAAGCCAICKGWKTPTECRAFSWTNQNGGTCWLKSETGASVPNPNVISATVFPNPSQPCTLEFGVDYFDNDIDNKPGANVFVCCDVCKTYPGGACKAFSWSNHNGGTCWLKSGKGSPIGNGNVHSGVVN